MTQPKVLDIVVGNGRNYQIYQITPPVFAPRPLENVARQVSLDKGKPAVRRGRKARGLLSKRKGGSPVTERGD